jgi:hypothetical protein
MRFRISLKMLTNIGPKILGHNAWLDKLTQKAANVRLAAKGMSAGSLIDANFFPLPSMNCPHHLGASARLLD